MSKQEEEYQAYLAEQQKEQIEQLASYQAIREWLDSLDMGDPRTSYYATLKRVLYLNAQLVTADVRDWEEIVAQIEEELT